MTTQYIEALAKYNQIKTAWFEVMNFHSDVIAPVHAVPIIADKFGGIYWNSGGYCMLASFGVKDYPYSIIVSDDAISLNYAESGNQDDALYLADRVDTLHFCTYTGIEH